MADVPSVTLADEERDEFLGRGGTGVLSISTERGEPPYSLPVSHGYDGTTGTFYFRLAETPDGGKSAHLEDGAAVSFVTYGDTADGWRSVVATGRLEAVQEDAVDAEVSEAMRRVQIPIVDVFDVPPRSLQFRFFRLDPDEITGRKEAHVED